MKQLWLWLLHQRAASLAERIAHGELLLRETRARLIVAHRELRKVRATIAEHTPASQLLAEAMGRRDAEVATRTRIRWGDDRTVAGGVASRTRHG